jgi:hypothetical protein
MAEKGMKVGVDDRALSLGKESKELASLVYIHSLFTYFQMRVYHCNMVKSRAVREVWKLSSNARTNNCLVA